jgi:ankyrin repeat protein
MGTNDPSSEKNPPYVVKLFFDQKFKNKILVDHDDDEGRTPLHLAVMLNRFSFVKYLLENGASIEVRYAVLSSD